MGVKICPRCGRVKNNPKGGLCTTCYKHVRLEQHPEISSKLQGRYKVGVKRVKPGMDTERIVYSPRKAPDAMVVRDNLRTPSSPWQGTLRMGLRLSQRERNANRLRAKNGTDFADPIALPFKYSNCELGEF